MRSLYLRIWVTVVLALALFALGAGWLWQRHLAEERTRFEATMRERVTAWGEAFGRSLPPAEAPREVQAQALATLSQRLRVPVALNDAQGARLAQSDDWTDAAPDEPPPREGRLPRRWSVTLDDGRVLWFGRRPWRRPPRPEGFAPHAHEHGGPARDDPDRAGDRPPLPPREAVAQRWFASATTLGPLVLLPLLLAAVGLGAWPVVRGLTRRLEALQRGVEAFGAGDLKRRVDASGRDEVAQVAASFNRSADRIEALVAAQKSLLANASHELRSPLARMSMALGLLRDADAGARQRLERELRRDIGELDALVGEVLLASKLDAGEPTALRHAAVDLAALAAEEGARFGVAVVVVPSAGDTRVEGDERLLRRALRNLLENAQRYGGRAGGGEAARDDDGADAAAPDAEADAITLTLRPSTTRVEVAVEDRGPGVPAALRERIFEPFYRLPGHAEREGGVGLGLALVRQIAQAHGGGVRCEAREGGGSRFVVDVPRAAVTRAGDAPR